MLDLRWLEDHLAASGRLSGQELKAVRELVESDRQVSRDEAELLVRLYKRARSRTHAFRQFVFNAIKRHVLADGQIDSEESDLLRRLLFSDDKLEDEERTFLHQLKGEAAQVSREFEDLFEYAEKEPPEQHTSGGGHG